MQHIACWNFCGCVGMFACGVKFTADTIAVFRRAQLEKSYYALKSRISFVSYISNFTQRKCGFSLPRLVFYYNLELARTLVFSQFYVLNDSKTH